MLLDLVPVVLVEPGQVRGPGRPAAGLSLHRRLARPDDERAPGQSRGPVSAVPLPYHHELCGRLPEAPQSHAGHRPHPGIDGEALGLMVAPRDNQDALQANQDSVQAHRLKWKCRRGLLELDIVLERFLKQDVNKGQLSELLDLADNDLWDIVAGRSNEYPPHLNEIVARLRAA